MNNETHEDRVKVLAGAPKINIDNSVLYVSSCGIYYKSINGLNNGKSWEFWDSSQIGKVDRWDWAGGIYLTELDGIRSLADIQKLVDMQNEIDRFKSLIEPLVGVNVPQEYLTDDEFDCICKIQEVLND